MRARSALSAAIVLVAMLAVPARAHRQRVADPDAVVPQSSNAYDCMNELAEIGFFFPDPPNMAGRRSYTRGQFARFTIWTTAGLEQAIPRAWWWKYDEDLRKAPAPTRPSDRNAELGPLRWLIGEFEPEIRLEGCNSPSLRRAVSRFVRVCREVDREVDRAGIAPPAKPPAHASEDLPQSHWVYDAINLLQQSGVAPPGPPWTGTGRPAITRGEAARITFEAAVCAEQLVVRGWPGHPSGDEAVATASTLPRLAKELQPELQALGLDFSWLRKVAERFDRTCRTGRPQGGFGPRPL